MTYNRDEFDNQVFSLVELQSKDLNLKSAAQRLLQLSSEYRYAYQFTWLGQPIIQLPEDIITTQEIIFKCKPDFIIDIGLSWGGGALLSATILEAIGGGHVIAIDKFIPNNIRDLITTSTLSHRITLLEADSLLGSTFTEVTEKIPSGSRVSLILDSNHEHNHVYRELTLYSPLVCKDQYISVYATAIEELNPASYQNWSWGKNNSPLSALKAFLQVNERFEINSFYEKKNLFSFAPSARLKCIR